MNQPNCIVILTGDCISQGMGMRQESKESLSSDHSLKDDVEEQWLSQVSKMTIIRQSYNPGFGVS